ncbi:MAG: PUA domain-containing protein, partial [Candidatus Bathyarchaeia archaeon]
RTGLEVKTYPELPEAIGIRVEGPHHIPFFSKKVVVDRFTAESVLLGAHVYSPGIKNCQGINKNDKVTVVDPLGRAVGSGIVKLCENDILEFRTGLAVQITHGIYNIPSFRESDLYNQGHIYPQSVPAMITSRVLEPKPGESIVDLTASPGGKLSHICQLTNNSCRAIAVDRRAGKIGQTKKTLARLGCSSVIFLLGDSRYFDLAKDTGCADRCLVDPPCSALGLRPKLYDNSTTQKIHALSNYQKQFVRTASRIVRQDGVVVYSVCTMTLEECEMVAKYGIEACGLQLEEPGLWLGRPGLDRVHPEMLLTQRFDPDIHETGFFIARFRKIRETPSSKGSEVYVNC